MTHKELTSRPEYYITNVQLYLFNTVLNFMERNNLSPNKFMDKLAVAFEFNISLRTVNKILKGNYNGRLNEYIKLSMKLGITFTLHNNDLTK